MRVPGVSSNDVARKAILGSPDVGWYALNYTKYPDAAISYLKFMMSEEEQLEQSKYRGTFSALKSIPAEKLFQENDLRRNIVSVWYKEGEIGGYPDNLSAKEVENEWLRLNPLVLAGKITVEEFAQALQEKRANLKK